MDNGDLLLIMKTGNSIQKGLWQKDLQVLTIFQFKRMKENGNKLSTVKK